MLIKLISCTHNLAGTTGALGASEGIFVFSLLGEDSTK